jgi:serine/threonine protein kinase
MSLQKLQKISEFGQSAYIHKIRKDGIIYAGKYFKKDSIGEQEVKQYDKLRALQEFPQIKPYIIKVIDALPDDEGFIMEYLDPGIWMTLKEGIESSEFKDEDKLYWIERLHDIVESLHARNWVHKDLHWNNVMINRFTNEIKIIDFGLSTSNKDPFPHKENVYGAILFPSKVMKKKPKKQSGIPLTFTFEQFKQGDLYASDKWIKNKLKWLNGTGGTLQQIRARAKTGWPRKKQYQDA